MGNIINGTDAYPIFNGKYQIISLIDTGRAAHVYLARSIKDPKVEVAIKINKKNKMCTQQAVKMARSEMEIHERMQHQNIIKVIEFGEHGNITKTNRESVVELFYIIMEYMPKGALYNVVQNHSGGIGEDGARFFMQQILETVKYLHDATVAHRDLTLGNILVNDKMQIKITDFGFSTFNDNQCDIYAGTLQYMAPEILEKKSYDGYAADIFSLGVISFILVTGSFPFTQATTDNSFYNLIGTNLEKYWQLTESSSCSDQFKELFASMVSYDPKDRPSLEDIINHQWFQAPSFKNQDESIRRQLISDLDLENKSIKSSLELSECESSNKE